MEMIKIDLEGEGELEVSLKALEESGIILLLPLEEMMSEKLEKNSGTPPVTEK